MSTEVYVVIVEEEGQFYLLGCFASVGSARSWVERYYGKTMSWERGMGEMGTPDLVAHLPEGRVGIYREQVQE